ncbi:MAG: hypothetical protein RI973_232 [Bacteroidota bacterium]|jgi:uncharacterized membrane protein (DUF4010 family)
MEENLIINIQNLRITQEEFLVRMVVAAGIGLTIGLEREFASRSEARKTFAGLRTFTIIVLLGFLLAFLSLLFSVWLFIAGFACLGLLTALSYWMSSRDGDIGGTSEMAGLVAFLLGGTTLTGFIAESMAITVVMLVLLSLKVKFKAIIGRITQEEIYAFVSFVVVALLVLPFLPDIYTGPYGTLNPRELGWVVVITSGVGFAGYLAMKFLGPNKGILVTGFLGGLVSSTAVTWIFSKKSKEAPVLAAHYATAIIAACTVMTARVAIWVAVFNFRLLQALLLPLSMVLLAGIAYAWILRKNAIRGNVEGELPLGSPLNLKDAVFFGLIYSCILVLIRFSSEQYGIAGIYISSALASLTDVDAVTISIAKLGSEVISKLDAQNAILLATVCNTIVKACIGLMAGSPALRLHLLKGFGAILLAGAAGFLWLNLL